MSNLVRKQDTRVKAIDNVAHLLDQSKEETLSEGFLDAHVQHVKDVWREITTIHDQILDDENLANDKYLLEDRFSDISRKYLEVHGRLLNLKASYTNPNFNSASASTPHREHSSRTDTNPVQLHTPRIPLPTFSGNYSEWESFADQFRTSIHERSDIPKVYKLNLLKQCLTGDAALCLKNVSTTEANYEKAWRDLEKRYRNTRILLHSYLSDLANLPAVESESATELRRLIDRTNEAIRALENLGRPVEYWDDWLIFQTLRRLHITTRKAWEMHLGPQIDPPTFKDFRTFIETHLRSLEMVEQKSPPIVPAAKVKASASAKAHHTTTRDNSPKSCSLCKGPHFIFHCEDFRRKSLEERQTELDRLRLCRNCLGHHMVKNCRSPKRCSRCSRQHNTLLHPAESLPVAAQTDSTAIVSKQTVSAHHAMPSKQEAASTRPALLATARVLLVSDYGRSTTVRALIDPGSETSFVSEAVAQKLLLRRRAVSVALHGIGAGPSSIARSSVRFKLQSIIDSSFQVEVAALVLPKVTGLLPASSIPAESLRLPDGCTPADPAGHLPGPIDVVLGADIYGLLIREGLHQLSIRGLVAQNTALGWILTGAVGARRAVSDHTSVAAHHCVPERDLIQAIRQFWELEHVPENASTLSPDEAECEQHYQQTHARLPDGRYEVRLPLRSGQHPEGADSRQVAISRLHSMERRFARDPEMHREYAQFMSQYEALQHMKLAPSPAENHQDCWYLPHHAVVQQSNNKRKLRVVFDASQTNSTGRSLNDYLLPGPALQSDLSVLLLQWRRYNVVFTADIVKMFRQILVHNDDQRLQRVVWREDSRQAVRDYTLVTLAYGTASAPYLAIRTLQQLAEDDGDKFPLAASCLLKETYVDDILTGADDIQSALNKQGQLIELLRAGGFPLDKWASNRPELLAAVPQTHRPTSHEFFPDQPVKTLGLTWFPQGDYFSFRCNQDERQLTADTKRAVLSCISRIFDPLGLITAVTITAKILLQDLWLSGRGWDQPLPPELQDRWRKYADSLPQLEEIKIDRGLGDLSRCAHLELHAFADASSRAYAACVYLRAGYPDGSTRVSLLLAKSKVAPVQTVTIPRLELCAAVLLARLLSLLRSCDTYAKLQAHAWSDSQVVLAWLRQHPSKWKVYVANRIAFIQSTHPDVCWRYVRSQDNPADLATRGVPPQELCSSAIWWHGPSWLSTPEDAWPPQPATNCPKEAGTEAKTVSHAFHVQPQEAPLEMIFRYSSLTKLIRITAYCLRFSTNSRRSPAERIRGFLKSDELRRAQIRLLKITQQVYSLTEIQHLGSGRPLPRGNALLPLNPFLDEDGILRVGGRLGNSALPFHEKHPPILTKDNPLTPLFIAHAHESTLHGGNMLTFSYLQRRVYVLRGKVLTKTYVRRCVRCFRARPSMGAQLMGDLPLDRTRPARPFSISGVDFAGPIRCRSSKGRGHRSYKAYIALFVCFATRAVHLELVSDLSAAAFIAAYRRFAGRRGVAARLYSDNATNFRGAEAELRAMFVASADCYKQVAEVLAQDGTEWHFIPPSSPHFGGLWEAGIKSVKGHLRKVIGEQTLTFEELNTLLIQVESCLNSRPLIPMTQDPEDLEVLTPAHFLINSALFTIPEPHVDETATLRSRWRLVQQLHQSFWRRWSCSYLQHLQKRAKWRQPHDNFAVGQLVICQDERYPPSKWPMGRIVKVHPGPDGRIRVVTVRTSTSEFQRPIVRLSPLPKPPDTNLVSTEWL